MIGKNARTENSSLIGETGSSGNYRTIPSTRTCLAHGFEATNARALSSIVFNEASDLATQSTSSCSDGFSVNFLFQPWSDIVILLIRTSTSPNVLTMLPSTIVSTKATGRLEFEES